MGLYSLESQERCQVVADDEDVKRSAAAVERLSLSHPRTVLHRWTVL